MNVFAQIVHEIAHRRLHATWVLLGIATTAALAVGFHAIGRASTAETARIMRDLGYNLRIVPAGTDRAALWRDGHSDRTMPAAGLTRFQEQSVVAYNHLLAMLQRRIELPAAGGAAPVPALLTGLAQEISPEGKRKGTMLFEVAPGTAHVGAAVARALELERGDTLSVLGEPFDVAATLAGTGSNDDLRIYVHLADAQRLLDQPGRINEIKALECACATKDGGDPRAQLRRELERILPEGEVIRIERLAAARSRQRRMAEDYFALALPVVLFACAAWLCFLFVLNVRERRGEIGLLRALGHGSGRIAALFLGKAALLGAAGAVLGFAAGDAVARHFGPAVFPETAGAVTTPWLALPATLLLAPLFAMASTLVPTLFAITQDPADTLREPR